MSALGAVFGPGQGLRSAEIELVCDYDGGTVLRNVEETVQCTYVFTITSPHGTLFAFFF